MFATIVVVLPSWFAGGAVRVAHGELSETYDNSANSLTTTSVLAWYTDVEHEVKHITAGYRLALSFNLIHTTSALRPALSPQNGVAARLRQVLLSWKEGESQDEAPAKLIYLLDHKYSQAALRGSALKGADAHLVALLDNIGRPHGFRLGLASLTCTERGSGNDYGGGCGYGRRGRYGRYGWGYSEDEDEDEDDVSMGEVEDTEISIKHLVDLDGKLIREDLDYELETEVIPDEVAEAITSGAYDEQEYEGYMGNVSKSYTLLLMGAHPIMCSTAAAWNDVSEWITWHYTCTDMCVSLSPYRPRHLAAMGQLRHHAWCQWLVIRMRQAAHFHIPSADPGGV